MQDLEKNEVSIHEVRIFRVLIGNSSTWFTSKEIAGLAKVGGSTARQKLIKLVRIGVVDQMEVFPSHLYRWSEKAKQRHPGYFNRLSGAADVFAQREQQEVKV